MSHPHPASPGARPLSLAFSPCPNDTFIFHALVHGLVAAPGVSFDVSLADVETLNRRALAGIVDVSKVSYGVLPFLSDEYVMLSSGGALGRGCGPLVVAPRGSPVARGPVAIPGRFTTANLLLRLFDPSLPPGVEMEYDRIMPAVAAGEVAAGLIIHESRFTYPEYGLVQIVDLGEWWERETGTPIPLGCIVARRSLGGTVALIESSLRDSVEYAFRDPQASAEYVREHAQEMDPEVTRRHIELYVNQHSLDLGDDGRAAVAELLARASAVEI